MFFTDIKKKTKHTDVLIYLILVSERQALIEK